ncbi:uncharacterized protein (DUF1919 family) [Cricetibacter osteomyelitidis]|uniref:Uncharacterized protein (DUF1919 family) n=1 Tax=Cricetibacter osteomyelitidis TaxID=1521931 RepID=A0A4V2T0H4_9PAST|nr:DUF1919 domain-containing protein [Cricetibacter osteomyelitidis]TCP89763.1 uncharacterized protein (DUF1919 family) [Cricetibacter osteomyelitidis]
MFHLIKKATNKSLRKFINAINRWRLKNHSMSVISSNCNGALILHDLGEKFNSPFVNLCLLPKDFIKYLQNIEHYMKAELHFEQTDKPYPVGKLDDLTIYFMHYHCEQEARDKWIERTARMNLDNLFILMTDRDGCSYEDLQAFEQLPYKNKIVFTHQKYPEISTALYVPGFENQGQVGDLFEFSGCSGKKYYDRLDYVAWFNEVRT